MPYPEATIKTAAKEILRHYQPRNQQKHLQNYRQLLKKVEETLVAAGQLSTESLVFPTNECFKDTAAELRLDGEFAQGFELTLFSTGNIQVKTIMDGEAQITHFQPQGYPLAALKEEEQRTFVGGIFAAALEIPSKVLITSPAIRRPGDGPTKLGKHQFAPLNLPSAPLAPPSTSSASPDLAATDPDRLVVPTIARRPRNALLFPGASASPAAPAIDWRSIFNTAVTIILHHCRNSSSNEKIIRHSICTKLDKLREAEIILDENINETLGLPEKFIIDWPQAFKLKISKTGEITISLGGIEQRVEEKDVDVYRLAEESDSSSDDLGSASPRLGSESESSNAKKTSRGLKK